MIRMPRLLAAGKALLALAAVTLSHTPLESFAGIKAPLRQPFFEQNRGQQPDLILYHGRFDGFHAAILRDGSLALADKSGQEQAHIHVAPKGARKAPVVSPSGIADFRTNYFRGSDPARHVTDVAHYARLTVNDIYPGIDLIYYIRDGRLEFDFSLLPGADPELVRLAITGATPSISAQGDLELETTSGKWIQRRPVAYQQRGEERVQIDCAYRLVGKGEVALAMASYDKTLPLIVDPVVDYSSYLGGSSSDYGNAVRIGPSGFLYVAGTTESSNFPTLAGVDSSLGGSSDAFVAKIDPATGRLVYATFLGGSNADTATAIAVGSDGAAYVTGLAEARYPTTTGAYQTGSYPQAGFVTKLAPAGNQMSYSTMLPGTTPTAIEVDSQGRAAVTGAAGTSFVTTALAAQTSYGGTLFPGPIDGDAFALLLNSQGSGVVFASFLGGSQPDKGYGVAIDGTGRVVIAGVTQSTNLQMVGPIQPTFAGLSDAFLAAFAADGRSIAYSTYFGGSGIDEIRGLSLDPYGNLVVAGKTGSENFPTLNALRTRGALSGSSLTKAFVAKFAVSPLRLVFSTFAGSERACCDFAYGVATDTAGEIYLFGNLRASEIPSFTSVNPFLSNAAVISKYGTLENADAFFVAGYSRDGQRLTFQTLVGACGEALSCGGGGISARTKGMAAIAGRLNIDWLPITAFHTQAAWANTLNSDAFFMTLVLEPPDLEISASTTAAYANQQVTLTATSYASGTGTITFLDGATSVGTAPLVEGVAQLTTTFTPGVRRLKAALGGTQSSLFLLPVALPTP